MILARGTTESYPGLLGSLTDLVMTAIPGSNYEDIIYPTTQEGSTSSYEEGIYNGTAQLSAYVKACPASKVVLLGYSQGAIVVSDMLAGGGDDGTLGNLTRPSVNLIQWARTKYPRTAVQLTALSKYANRVHDYCDNKDGVCEAAGMNHSAHMAYATILDNTAATWVVNRLQAE
ncbi:hypothetical protein N7481_002391 [Penicillium waksmanii]|uniref:uncharacterized protein n=1 Tax=Penicillium waksmanii TaxID=69791 RepID=UPI002546BD3F|nr:uncharacterized protein N7481_002391 [Penicillium waksmanii]KAJ5995414.1 hypothetical protein N7481_002391 [Penicillium waksmanii]